MNNPAEPVFPQPLIDAFTRDPDTPAFEFRTRPVGRGRVLGMVRACAAALAAAGLGPGRGIAVTTDVTPAGFAAQIAAHLLGCRVTGLRPGLTPGQLRHVLAQDVHAVLTDDTTRTEALTAAAEAAGALVLDLARDLLDGGDVGGDPGGNRDGDTDSGPDRAPDGGTAPGPELVARGRADDIALITLTSGSTGNPKGCAQTYRALGDHWSWQPLRWSDTTRQLAAGYRRFLLFGTLTSAVMLEHLALCLLSGGTAVIPDGPVSFPHTWQRHRVTACLCTVPRLYEVLATLRTEHVDTSAMRALLVAGSPLPPHRLAEAADRLGPVVHQGYGQTETGMLALLTPEDQVREGDRVRDSVGRPMPGVDVSVRDPEGRPVPAGTTGEIWVRAGGAMSGYWHDRAETREVVRDGWIRTRDLGTLRDDGFLRLAGRARDVVFVNAILHYTAAIESALTSHPDVDEAYVVAAPDEDTGEAAHAFVVPASPDRVPDPAALRAAVRAELGDGAVPATLTVLAAVPVAPSGKPDKRALRERVVAQQGDRGGAGRVEAP
ncbi:Acyl-CoA synthetase (AMP-forming)/AMP-acid ligase II [Actinacidiphila yanglinensis]|uniref:Acyl-CoA synthetase (AMP-forming)/AMP-acid ligase II n=1 Tax=Actinacidiphila yanglinensis TaxID=310779 RepID=A0A1H6CVF2_9ACTN|nr:fatty acid--CoA ligase family protein [Actinacidiphila yanglinensis]SEG76962.1 Acyl-CoA synthetase (AMP-forming)/AMP-acid ligase II [Actinacidiphila yanglinensis]